MRKDFLLNRFVLIAANRNKRPSDFKRKAAESKKPSQTCFFCPGNEHLTPPEISRISDNHGNWRVRCFPNKYVATSPDFPRAYGKHEVIVETPEHGRRLSQLSLEQTKLFLDMYVQRLNALRGDPRIGYASIFKNEGQAAGASIIHTHTQIIATDIVPPAILEEITANANYKQKHKKCGYCDLLKLERERVFYENASFVCFCPFASQFYFECVILSRKHVRSLVDLSEKQLLDLAGALKTTLARLDKLLSCPAFNFHFHIAPFTKGDYHFHVRVYPQLAKWAGFEHSTGIVINQVPPEQAADLLKIR